MKINFYILFSVWILSLIFISCSKKEVQKSINKGIGPIKNITLEATIDLKKAEKGKQIFEEKCTSCHKLAEKYVGPPLEGITKKRSPEWILNMILNPEQMIEEDPDAQALFQEYLSKMISQDISKEEAMQIFEYFRSVDENI